MNFNLLLERSVKIHGHLCPGQVLGVKMAMLGMEMPSANPAAAEKPSEETQVPNVKDVLRGIFGR